MDFIYWNLKSGKEIGRYTVICGKEIGRYTVILVRNTV